MGDPVLISGSGRSPREGNGSPLQYATGEELLLLATKAKTNLDSALKSRDITMPTKVHIVNVMVFPVVMYGCENWIIEKAEH